MFAADCCQPTTGVNYLKAVDGSCQLPQGAEVAFVVHLLRTVQAHSKLRGAVPIDGADIT